MRRILLTAFVLIFSSQSSGIGLAVEKGQPAYQDSLFADLHSVFDGLMQTPLVAMITTSQLYAAMHAPPPNFNHPVPRPSVVSVLNRSNEPRIVAVGVPVKPAAMVLHPIVPDKAPKDPTATSSRVSTFSLRRAPAARTSGVSTLARRTQGIATMSVLPATTTGINPWWTYEEDGIPGVGRAMVNVANGNLIVQSDDVDIPERGIDLAYRRTYNSQSTHDWNNTDGSVPSNFGEGWTSTFDAHMSYDSTDNILSVWDIDGARYDYTSDGNGNWLPPTGQHATLVWDGHCGYQWTKKTGTMYYFYRPDFSTFSGCMGPAGFNGRLSAIYARNWNNTVTLTYSWTGGDASSAANLSQITVAHSDGQQVILTFANFGGAQRELSSIARPDGKTVTYWYDTSGNLRCVDEIGNNVAASLEHCYYYQNGHQLYVVQNPRLLYTYGLNGNSVQEGDELVASYNASNQITQLFHWGVVNFTPGTYQYPSDGTNAVLQPGAPTGPNTWHNFNFSGYGSGTVSMTDTDGHATNWVVDSAGRVAQTSEWNGSVYLVTTATWDANNNLTETTDARTKATDYAYDANGNTIAVALPSVLTNQGTFRPTSLYSYDNRNNITAYCDPVHVGANGYDWVNRPSSDTLCAASGATRYTWVTDNWSLMPQPYGYLTDAYTPMNHHVTYSYNASYQGGAFGLPTDVTGDCFTQYDSTQNCPHQSFAYDGYGNLSSYNKGNGAWALTYDNLNRVTRVTDPDGISSRTCYFNDGEVSATQTAAQYAADGNVACGGHSVSFTYDADGNKITEVHHYNNQAGTATSWYDGADRNVEVALPHDATNDVYGYAWLTRTIYDLSQGGTVTIGSAAGLLAHGNFYKTQEWVAVSGGSPAWTDLKGDAYDALDRVVHHYIYQPGTNNLNASTNSYDQNAATYGLLTNASNQLGEVTTPSYDADGKTIATNYSGDGGVTPSQTLAFDADARITTATSSSLGQQITAYDADGEVTSVQEPSGGGLTSAAALTYSYYPNGQRSALSVTSSALTQNNLLQYAYRTDGLRSKLAFADGAQSASWSWTLSSAGRAQSLSDSSGQGDSITYDAYGRPSTDAVPAGTMSNYQYDAENEVTSFSIPGNTQTNGYDVRGELVSQVFGSDTCGGQGDLTPPLYQQSANGYMVTAAHPGCSTGPPAIAWDVRNAVGTASASGSTGQGTGYNYDPAGRQNSANQSWSYTHNCGDQQCEVDGNGTLSRSYDAQNHLIGETVSTWDVQSAALTGCLSGGIAAVPTIESQSFSYAWGPNGHPDLWSGNTLHWDGDTPLFITNGSLVEIKIEGLGFYAPGATHPMQFLDRDQAGYVVGAHWSGGTSAFTPANPYHQVCDNRDLSGYALFEPGPDGIGDGANIIQGVRNFDPALGTWTSPDAYAGDVSDPMSKKAYMWNRNNAFTYQDPSGYVAYWVQDFLAIENNVYLAIPIKYENISKDEQDAITRDIENTYSGPHGKFNVTAEVVDCQKGGLCNTVQGVSKITMGGNCGPTSVGCAQQPGNKVQIKLTGNSLHDAQTVLQEIGHGMGLGHVPTDTNNVMYPFDQYPLGQWKITQSQIQAILSNRANRPIP